MIHPQLLLRLLKLKVECVHFTQALQKSTTVRLYFASCLCLDYSVQHCCFFNYCRTTEVLPGSKPGIQSCRSLDSASGGASCTTAAGCGWPAGWTRCSVWASSCRGEDDSFLLMREKTDTVYRSHALGKKITTFSN